MCLSQLDTKIGHRQGQYEEMRSVTQVTEFGSTWLSAVVHHVAFEESRVAKMDRKQATNH